MRIVLNRRSVRRGALLVVVAGLAGLVVGLGVATAAGDELPQPQPYPPRYPGYPGYPGVPIFWWPCPDPRFPAPGPTPTPRPAPPPGPWTSLSYTVCTRAARQIPLAVQQQALTRPWEFYGYGMRLNPSVPYHPLWNSYRTSLNLLDAGKPWNPCNPAVWKAGCH